MSVLRRAFTPVLTPVLAVALVLVASLSCTDASASTVDDLAGARDRLAAARDAANEAAAEFTEAEDQLAATEHRIVELQVSIDELRSKGDELRGIVRQRALYAYTHQGQDLDLVVDAANPVLAARRTRLLDRANERDNSVVRKLAAIDEDVREQQSQLREQRARERTVRDQLEVRSTALRRTMNEAQQAANALQQQLDREIAAAVAVLNEARQRELEAERARIQAAHVVSTRPASTGPTSTEQGSDDASSAPTASSVGAGQVIGPTVGGFACPVSGAAYSDDYGGARGHQGIDMFVPTGTPAVAVTSGTVSYVPNEGAGGNTAYLSGNDGNVYFYAHFSQFVGGGRSVAQGEIIGLTGMTGNAGAPHLHFEIRVGGANGTRINPYPTLRGAGC